MTLIERFLKYVSIPTNSSEGSKTLPSTEKQWVLARALRDELTQLGFADVRLSDSGYVYATVPANCDAPTPVIGFIAHMDTSSAAPDESIKPREILYEGGDILLNAEKNIVMSAGYYPQLPSFAGKHLIITDGTTLLGADDKAGVAEIVTAAEFLLHTDKPHGTVKIAFTPDEEIGRGVDDFDIPFFGCDYAYTVDGGAANEMEYECFNAASARIEINGVSIHPGSAKDKMKNAALYACEFAALLPADETPATTEGYQGFYHLGHIEGNCEHASLRYILRDHDAKKLEEKKDTIRKAAEYMNGKYGEGTVEVTVRDAYRNMRELIEKDFYIVERACDAMRQVGLEPVSVPIRGGTDGASLTYKGLPCPNLGTGGQNYHSRFEFACVEEMEACVEIIERIALNAVGCGK